MLCYLHNHAVHPHLFALRFPFSESLIAYVKSYQGATWHPGPKFWTLDRFWLDRFKTEAPKGLKIVDKCDAGGIEAIFVPGLFEQGGRAPYQEWGATWMRLHETGFLLNYAMRVGKTPTVLGEAELRRSGQILVVVPAVARPEWPKEIAKWWPSRTENVCVIKDGGKSLAKWVEAQGGGPGSITVVSYALLAKLLKVVGAGGLGGHEWRFEPDMIVADEVHHITNTSTQAAKALALAATVWPRAVRRGLTGTAFTNNPIKVYGIAEWLWPHMFGSFENFGRRYAGRKPNEFTPRGFEFKGMNPDTADELRARLDQYSIRLTRDDPEVRAFFPPASAQAVEAAGFNLKEWCLNAIQNGETHLVILAYRRDRVDEVFAEVSGLAPCAKVSGEQSPEQRRKVLDEIRALPAGIVCATIDSTWGAVDLSFCSTPLYVELTPKLVHMIQSFDRFVKFAKGRPVSIQVLIDRSQERKFATMQKALAAINTVQRPGEAEAGLGAVFGSATELSDEAFGRMMTNAGCETIGEEGW